MKIELISHTRDIETIIATSMLTTTSSKLPSKIYSRLSKNPEKVKKIVERAEFHHGNIFEHNKLIWRLDAKPEQVLDIILHTKYFTLTKEKNNIWILSGNLRALIEYVTNIKDEFGFYLLESIVEVTPTVYKLIRRKLV